MSFQISSSISNNRRGALSSKIPTLHHGNINLNLNASAENNFQGDRIINNQNELDEYAKSVGVKITFSTLGPGYRAVARAEFDPEQILGYCEGFVRPGECCES